MVFPPLEPSPKLSRHGLTWKIQMRIHSSSRRSPSRMTARSRPEPLSRTNTAEFEHTADHSGLLTGFGLCRLMLRGDRAARRALGAKWLVSLN